MDSSTTLSTKAERVAALNTRLLRTKIEIARIDHNEKQDRKRKLTPALESWLEKEQIRRAGLVDQMTRIEKALKAAKERE